MNVIWLPFCWNKIKVIVMHDKEKQQIVVTPALFGEVRQGRCDTACTLWCGPKQLHWNHLEEVVSAQLQTNSGVFCLF